MGLLSFIQARRLPEKPWRTAAVVRFLSGVLVCMLSGMAAIVMVQYFATPHSSSAAFLAFSCGTLACFAAALVVLMRPWPLESFPRKLLLFLLFFYGGFALMWLASRLVTNKDELGSSVMNVLISVLGLQGAAAVLAHFFLREHQMSWGEGFGFSRNPGFGLLVGVFVGFIALWATQAVLILSTRLLELLNFQPQEQDAVTMLRSTEGWKDWLIMGIVTIGIAPLGEEILFRGILYPWIKRMGYPRLALWVTALVFATIHHNVATFVPLTFLAIVLVGIYEYTGNLLACITTHMLFNAANFIVLFSNTSK